jgi:hypothetical protein
VNSASTGGGNARSGNPVISLNGRVVAFASEASNLHSLNTDTTNDVFAHDISINVTHLVSVNSEGTGSGNFASSNPVVSADGHVVAFHSTATNLSLLDTDFVADVFARDLLGSVTHLISK